MAKAYCVACLLLGDKALLFIIVVFVVRNETFYYRKTWRLSRSLFGGVNHNELALYFKWALGRVTAIAVSCLQRLCERSLPYASIPWYFSLFFFSFTHLLDKWCLLVLFSIATYISYWGCCLLGCPLIYALCYRRSRAWWLLPQLFSLGDSTPADSVFSNAKITPDSTIAYS